MITEATTFSAQQAEQLAALENLVVDQDGALAELESRIGRFNIFDALGIARAEIKHSNFLAFILDPAESHGQGQLFLRALLMDLLKTAPKEARPLSPIDLDGIDLRGVEIKREWRRIDLLITCQDPKFVVVIENKVDSGEHSKQLEHYEEAIEQHYPGTKPLYVFLTLPGGDEPSRENWVQYTYESIHRVLTRVRETYRNAIGDDVQAFLNHYLDLIGSRFMNNEEIDKLCQRIYTTHRQALDLIWERVGSPASGLLAEVMNIVKDDTRWSEVDRWRNVFAFVPTKWLDWLPPFGLRSEPRGWIYLQLGVDETALYYNVDGAPVKDKDAAKRNEIVAKLIEKSTDFGFKRPRSRNQEVKNIYCRVTASERILSWTEGNEPDADRLRGEVKKILDGLYPKLDILAAVLKPLCEANESE
ncbi:MAG: PD-(D/E)XK nuclease family protein [Gemmataceae bacterium]|nr:PD-(D/E)XK nuclease family protein [Gemmataceae bacterium]